MYQFHEDPGHGWLEVQMSELQSLRIEGEISQYSYQSRDGRIAYLEEDCDLAKFLRAKCATGLAQARNLDARAFFAELVREVHYSDDAFIRHLPRFPSRAQSHTAALFAVGAI